MEQKVNVFFDESGKDGKELSLMGALLIPDDFYRSPAFNEINQRLKAREFSLHFTDLTKHGYVAHKKALEVMLKYADHIKFNVVAYKKNEHISEKKLKYTGTISKMIYSKIPERVLYGVLRDYGNFSEVVAKLFIEECTQYQELKLHKMVEQQLNIHSLYRNENYWVKQAGLYPKNKEIGIELTDTILGILRTIIENKPAKFENGQAKNSSKTLWRKKSFIGKSMYQIDKMRSFLCDINYFELDGQNSLQRKSVKSYLDLFMARYEREQEELKNSM